MNRRRIAQMLPVAILWMVFGIHGALAQPPSCQVDIVSSTGQIPLEVQFDALNAGFGSVTYHWDFGDGATSTDESPLHVYSQSGIYSAVLTVTPEGAPESACRDTAIMMVGIVGDPVCLGEPSSTWSESSEPIVFTFGPAFAPEPPYEWTLNFGDGTTHTVLSPDGLSQPVEHAYAVPGTYWATVWLTTTLGTYRCWRTTRITTLVPQVVGVDPRGPSDLRLETARPNPFGTTTSIGFTLPREGQVRLVILDLQGRHVATLVDEVRNAGHHAAPWDARADAGHVVAAGVYVAVLEQAGKMTSTRIVRMP